jgi:hypothetical protein
MLSNQYTASDFRRARDWVREEGGGIFPTFSAFEWFKRKHRAELIESGELITRRGTGGDLVGPGFGRKAVEILQREQQGAA